MTMLLADANGRLSGKFTVPANITSGDKKVSFYGIGGSKGDAIFSSQGTLQRKVMQLETSITETRWQSPPPPPPTYDPPSKDDVDDVTNPDPGISKFDIAKSLIEGAVQQLNIRGFSSAATNIDTLRATIDVAASSSDQAAALKIMNEALVTTQKQLEASGGSFVGTPGVNDDRDMVYWVQGSNAASIYSQLCKVDPLAQTFSLASPLHLSSVDLWFAAKGSEAIRVDIRTVNNGYPTTSVIATAFIAPGAILTNGASSRITFDSPVALAAGTEYALVVMANDEVTAVSIAELGKWDSVSSQWVTSQPYTVGVLLSSSNAVTWTAHQEKDMAFRLVAANYSQNSRTVGLGSVTVTGATDLLLMSYAETPTSETHVSYTLTLPDASTVVVSDGQPVRLASAITGSVSVSATLSGNALFSPVLTPGTQLAYGTVATTADYISRAIPAGTAARVKIIFDAIIPSGASVSAFVKGIDGGDTWTSAAYQSSVEVGDSWREVTHELASITEASVHVKLTLAGNTNARPRVRNLRVIVL